MSQLLESSPTAEVQAMGEALIGTGKAFVGASGTLMAGGRGRVWTENDVAASGPRVVTEKYIIELAERAVRSSIVRISPATHSSTLDRNGFVLCQRSSTAGPSATPALAPST